MIIVLFFILNLIFKNFTAKSRTRMLNCTRVNHYCVCMCMCLCVCVYIYCTHTYTYIKKYHIIVLGLDSLEARRWINDMICRYISTYTYIHVYTRHTHTHMHTHTHTHTHIPICIDIYGGSMT